MNLSVGAILLQKKNQHNTYMQYEFVSRCDIITKN